MQTTTRSAPQEGVGLAVRERTDRDLLACFLDDCDDASFEMLVSRHAPRMLAVCRLVLHHRQDAEDAFQQTLLVLMRKAASLQNKDIGRWLKVTAYHIAQNVRTRKKRREKHERRFQSPPPAQPLDEAIGHEEQFRILSAILSLSDESFIPVLLHYEEGMSRAEIARFLEAPEGTIANRLKKARQLVKQELIRRGIIP